MTFPFTNKRTVTPAPGSGGQVTATQTGQPGAGPDLATKITRFYGGAVDMAQPAFRLNNPGVAPGHCLLWNDPVLMNPVNAPWRRIVAAWAMVTTSAVVKTRLIEVAYTDNQHEYFRHQDNSYPIAASAVNVRIAAAIGAGGNTNPNGTGSFFFSAAAIGLPDIWLPPGCVFTLGLGNFDAGDLVTEARLLVEEAGPILQAYNAVTPPYITGQQPNLT